MIRTLFCFLLLLTASTASTRFAALSRLRPPGVVAPERTARDGLNNPKNNKKNQVTRSHVASDQANNIPETANTKKSTSASLVSKSALMSCVSFLAGVGDIITYRRYGFYANMMTGNTIRFVTALTELRLTDALVFGSVVACYSMGVCAFRLVDLKTRQQQTKPTTTTNTSPSCTFIITSIFVSLFVLVDILVKRGGNQYLEFRGFVPLLSLGYGMLNALATIALDGTVSYAMTGHVTKLGHALAERLVYGSTLKKKRGKAKTCGRVLIFFSLGLISGTVLFNFAGPWMDKIPPYSTLGTMYALLFGLSHMSMPQFGVVKKTFFNIAETVRQGRATVGDKNESQIDVTMDGWNTVPTGPLHLQDGQKR